MILSDKINEINKLGRHFRIETPSSMWTTKWTIPQVDIVVDRRKITILEVMILKAIAYYKGKYDLSPTGEQIREFCRKRIKIKMADSDILIAIELLRSKKLVKEVT